MSKKNKHKNREGVVYSTNPDFEYNESFGMLQETLDPDKQNLIVRIERKGRAGKVATLVEGFVGSPQDLNDLGKMLKTKLGVGGSQKDGLVIIQGDVKVKTCDILKEAGYRAKLG